MDSIINPLADDRMPVGTIRPYLEGTDWDFDEFPLHMTGAPRREDLDLLIRHKEAVADLRLFMRDVYAHPEDDPDFNWEETHWSSLVVGYLCGKGVPPGEAFTLDTFLGYNLQYFAVDPDIKERV